MGDHPAAGGGGSRLDGASVGGDAVAAEVALLRSGADAAWPPSAPTCSAPGCSSTSTATSTTCSSAGFSGPPLWAPTRSPTRSCSCPYNQIASPVQEVLFPAMSRMQDDLPRMATGWLRSNRLIASISLPSLVGVAVVAPDLVDVVLGSKWQHRDPRHPGADLGGPSAVDPAAELDRPAGLRPHARHAALLDHRVGRQPGGVRHRPALGRGRGGHGVRALEHRDRAVLHLADDAGARASRCSTSGARCAVSSSRAS